MKSPRRVLNVFEQAPKTQFRRVGNGELWIPGHGGMMDRIDSILFVGPVVYLYFHIVLGL